MKKPDALTPEKQALLARRLKGAAANVWAGAAPVRRVPRRESSLNAPLSFAQFYVWASDRALPGNPSFNLPYGIRLHGPLDSNAVEQGLNALVQRHESLRTTFAIEDGTPVQVVHPDCRIEIKHIDLSPLAQAERDVRLQALATEESVTPFDITRLPLIRVQLYRLDAADHTLIINMHHIVSDGLSLDPLFREMDALYTAFARGVRAHLPELPVQYADFSIWLRHEVANGAYAAQEAYWRKQLHGRLATMALPFDHPRPAVRTFLGGNVHFTIAPALVERLSALNFSSGGSFFTVALAAFQTLLYRCSGSEDLLILTPVSIRNYDELKPLIGDLLNLVPLRCDISGNPTFSELLRRSREATLDALSNKDLPFDRIVDGVSIERRSGRDPVFQSLLQVLAAPAVKLGDLVAEPFDIDAGVSQFDLSLHLYERDGGYRGRFEYSTELFERVTAEHLCANFLQLLEMVLANTEVPVTSIALPYDVRSKSSSGQEAAAEAPRAVPHVAPQGAFEKRIAKIWRHVLQVDQVGVNDNFFDLGGHSLLLVKTCQLLGAELGLTLAVVDLFTYPTVAALARHLGGSAPTCGTLAADAASRMRRRANGDTAEPIAIIGMAGRFPGARDVESFWENLRVGKESIRFFSVEELREAGIPDQVLNESGYVRAYGYLEDVDQFDASFFGYSARDAEVFDPQERLLLQVANETLERAGYDPDRYSGPIGVYAGSQTNRYLSSTQTQHIPLGEAGWASWALAAAGDFLTTRISYKLNLRGPSLNVQTACSTSLVAVHQACRALQDGECDMALAGGVAIVLPQKCGVMFVEGGIFSHDGHCRAFDANATGTIGGNGLGFVLLKRLSEAVADGDHIHAVIRGTAINNDGAAKAGYTAPSVEGQAQVIALAQAAADCAPDTISYVEAHGTATALGDPIEIKALTRVFGDGSQRLAPCYIGSVKTNIGHLFVAAGVTGLIKTALSLEHRELVPSLHFKSPNPQIDFANGPFRVITELRPWEHAEATPRRAGVSAFGFGGTNAHAVLEEAPPSMPSDRAREWQLLPLSAKNDTALTQVVENLARYLRDHPDANLADVAYTLQVGRREHQQRVVVACRDVSDAVDVLGVPASPRILRGAHKSGHRAVQFMFTGQGAQYPNMCHGLYRTQPVFRDAVDRCCERLKSSLGYDLRETLFPAPDAIEFASERLQRTEVTQPALFTIECALASLWMSFGIQPAAMIGHSIGEYVAAFLAGVMSLEDALDLVAERGRLMGQLPAGSMLAVPMPEAEVCSLLGERLSLAGVNSPMMCVISGPSADVDALEAELVARGQSPRRLRTSHAFHSSMMDPILDAFTVRVRRVTLRAPTIPYVSNVTGNWISPQQATDPTYYATHLRQAVRFADGLERLFADSTAVFLEVGPGNTLASLAKRHPEHGPDHAFIASTRRPDETQEDAAAFLESVGRLWLAGVRPSWDVLHGGTRRRRVILPTYPFQGRRYWLDSARNQIRETSAETSARKPDPADWVYVPSWKRVPNPPKDSAHATGRARWLMFADESGVAEQLARRLTTDGDFVTTVHPGRAFENRGNGTFFISPGNEQHYEALLKELADEHELPTRIVHLWAITGNANTDAHAPIEAELDRFFWGPVCLAKSVGHLAIGKRVEITFIANGLYEVTGDERLHPMKATMLGPCRVIPNEYPGVTCRSVDVALPASGKSSEQLVEQLVRELRTAPTDASIAYRGGHRWVRTYEPARVPMPEGQPSRIRKNGVYLITGGLGGIGLAIAEHFAVNASARLVLVGRTPLPDSSSWDSWLTTHPDDDRTSQRIRKVRHLEEVGGEVLVVSADVTDCDQMAEVVKTVRERWGEIHGVVHAAGLPAGGVIELKTLESAREILAPKIQGTMVLDEVLADVPLDFMVLCSSISAVLGEAGQVDYVAANAFLDTFAQSKAVDQRRPTVAIGWDAWNEAGMAVETEASQNLGRQRQEDVASGIRNAEGADLTYRLLDCSLPHVVVSPRNLSWRIARSYAPVEMTTGKAEPGETSSTSHVRPAMSSAYEAPRDDVERLLAGIWGTMLGVDQVGIHDNFFELGGDSVISIQITAKANQAGLKFTPRQAFEHQTIAALAEVARTRMAAAALSQDAARPAAKTDKAPSGRGVSAADLAEIRRQLSARTKKNS